MDNWILNLIVGIAGALVGGLVAGFFSLRAIEQSYKHQKILEEDRKKDLIKSVFSSIRDEVTTVWSMYMDRSGSVLEALSLGTPLLTYYPIDQDYMTVYAANASLIGAIEDNELRHQIIRTYVKAKGLIDSFKFNNSLIEQYNQWAWISAETSSPLHDQRRDVALQSLVDYSSKIKHMHFNLKEDIEVLINKLDQATEQPTCSVSERI